MFGRSWKCEYSSENANIQTKMSISQKPLMFIWKMEEGID